MIVNPYAEQESLADQIRNFTQGDFPTAMASADAAIQSMLSGATSDPHPAPPSWRHRLTHWIMHTFLVNRGIAEAAILEVLLPVDTSFMDVELGAGIVTMYIELAAGAEPFAVEN